MEQPYQLDKYGELALSLVKSGEPLFITGKAGTGKTTLLKAMLEALDKRIAVVAPTGVAAKNAVGITIHSFLRLPTTPYFPGIDNLDLYNLSQAEKEVIMVVDTIIIDEVSMVRCDLLDAMDDVLRHYRKNNKPFGGIQLVMFGDLYQLMPVAPTEEWEELKKYYDSPYFFSSKSYQMLGCKMLELKKVYRQSDSDFITILNNIREGKSSLREIGILNTRYKERYIPKPEERRVILTTHKRRAKGYNWGCLEKLKGELRELKAKVKGWFPRDEFPAPYTLQLKKYARVMFVRNDITSNEYYNGLTGTISRIGPSYIVVEADNGKRIFVSPQKWDHQRYVINKKTKKLEVEVTGSFIQYPLILAWAVTIHKSQGLTFENAVIDAANAFTFGQVYVALSRCRTLKGIILTSKLTSKAIMVDDVVKNFMTTVERIEVENEENDEVSSYLKFKNPEERTLFWIRNGYSVEEIVEQTGEQQAIIFSHLAKLASQGKVDARNYVTTYVYKLLCDTFQKKGINADRRSIKELFPSVSYGEIELVRAHLARQNRHSSAHTDTDMTLMKENVRRIELNVSLARLNRIEDGSKKTISKAIRDEELGKTFFEKWNGKFVMADGTLSEQGPSIIRPKSNVCPFVLRRDFDIVNFISHKTKKVVSRKIVGMTVKAGEEQEDGRFWIVTISFR